MNPSLRHIRKGQFKKISEHGGLNNLHLRFIKPFTWSHNDELEGAETRDLASSPTRLAEDTVTGLVCEIPPRELITFQYCAHICPCHYTQLYTTPLRNSLASQSQSFTSSPVIDSTYDSMTRLWRHCDYDHLSDIHNLTLWYGSKMPFLIMLGISLDQDLSLKIDK